MALLSLGLHEICFNPQSDPLIVIHFWAAFTQCDGIIKLWCMMYENEDEQYEMWTLKLLKKSVCCAH